MDRAGVDQTTLAKRLKISRPAVGQWLKGKTAPAGMRVEGVALALGTTASFLLEEEGGAGSPAAPPPVVGYVNGDEVVLLFKEMVDSEQRDTVALSVRGAGMLPTFWDGDLIVFARDRDYTASQFLYQECVLRLEDGSAYVKVVFPGRSPETFTLFGNGSPPMVDAQVRWAAPVLIVDRTGRGVSPWQGARTP